MKGTPRSKSALVVVDIQNDFLPGGTLGVQGGDQVISVANRLQERFDTVVMTQDWHPASHGSFAANHPGKKPYEQIELNGIRQTLWPVHCVQHTPGAAFAPGLKVERVARVFQKGTDPGLDSYSGLFDNAHRRATGMGDWLKEHGIESIYICGLATDYCVRFTALDALALGFRTFVIEDGCRGVEVHPGDVADALAEMRRAGATVISSADLLET